MTDLHEIIEDNYNYNRDLLCAPYKQNDGALHCYDILAIKALLNKKVLRRLLKVSFEHVVVFSSDGRPVLTASFQENLGQCQNVNLFLSLMQPETKEVTIRTSEPTREKKHPNAT